MQKSKLIIPLVFIFIILSNVILSECSGKTQKYEVNLKADPAKGGKVTGEGTYKEGEEVQVEAESAEGYNFKNWSENGKEISTEKSYNFDVKEDRKLVAEFQNEGDLNGTLAEAAQALEEERWAKAGEYLAEAEEMPGAEEKQIYKDIDQYVIEALKKEQIVTRNHIVDALDEIRLSEPSLEILEGEPENIYKWFQSLSERKSKLVSFPRTILTRLDYKEHNVHLFTEEAIKELERESKKYLESGVRFNLDEFHLWEYTFYRDIPSGFSHDAHDLRDAYILRAENELRDIEVQDNNIVITIELKEGIENYYGEFLPGEYKLTYEINRKDDGIFKVGDFTLKNSEG